MEQTEILNMLRGYHVFCRDDIRIVMNSSGEQYGRNTADAHLRQYLQAVVI